ncbi:MAG: alkylmercury lyase family protein [Acidobacteria bacterium]|nr:alkylmercury lyase family protein [Acidobacteriota bacterium]
MTSLVDSALERLNLRLPLAARLAALPPELVRVHRAILRSLYDTGSPPAPDQIAAMLSTFTLERALDRLDADDLAVLSPDRTRVLGAYPMTSEPTPHLVETGDRAVHAMCAVDALAISPMFGGAVAIRSRCRITKTPVTIRQQGCQILSAEPAGVLVGVRWEHTTRGHAAHSLCMEMVYLRDEAAAREWHHGDTENHTVLPLGDAVELGARFFTPLV